MALPRIIGVETEFGIIHRGSPDANPITASSMLINAYLAETQRDGGQRRNPKVGWNFEDETPGSDARGAAPTGALPPEVETHLVNAVLTNGARYYVDHAHPEMSSPECADPLSIVRYDKASEEVVRRSMAAARRILPEGEELVVYKNNSDRKGNSYGAHENYLMDRSVPFARVAAGVMGHFITRQIYTGAGKVGSEAPGMSSDRVPFQITQRADFFEEPIGLETTLKRPIVNTRDEPHADAHKYRRLHVIVGDANLAQVATFLKVGTTALVICMIEDDWQMPALTFANPVQSLRAVSYDLSLAKPLTLADGSTITALEAQWELFHAASEYAERHGLDALGSDTGPMVLERWEGVLHALETDPASLSGQLDWVAKHRLLDGYRQRHDLSWDDDRLAAMDIQYHDLRPERSLFARLDTEELVSSDDVLRAVTEPPEDTRAYFRGRCLQRWSDQIVAANWDSLVFDLGGDPLRRVPMMEPSRGTRSHVGSLLDEASSAADMLDKLGA